MWLLSRHFSQSLSEDIIVLLINETKHKTTLFVVLDGFTRVIKYKYGTTWANTCTIKVVFQKYDLGHSSTRQCATQSMVIETEQSGIMDAGKGRV